jgi:hypothetical protein
MPVLPVTSATDAKSATLPASRTESAGQMASSRRGIAGQFLVTFLSNWLLFGIFFVQGVMVARILGPEGRGAFGSILFFPRDLLLYVGLLGGIEVITALAGKYRGAQRQLRGAAARLAIVTGFLSMAAAILLAGIFLPASGKGGLLGLVALTSLFLPLEHLQLIVSGVDRGSGAFGAYNRNRIWFGLAFPLLLAGWYFLGGSALFPGWELEAVCVLFVLSRAIGLVPTIWEFLSVSSGQAAGVPANLLPSQELKPRRLLQLGRGFGLSMLASELFERLDVLLIVMLASYSVAGNYFVAIPAATLVTLLPNAAGVFAFNAGANAEFKPTRALIAGMIVGALVVQAAMLAVLWGLLPLLIRSVFGAEFEPAIQFALWLLPVCALKGYLQFADGFLKGRGRTMIGVWARCAGIVCMLLVVWFLYPSWNILAIPAAALAGQVLVNFLVSWACLQSESMRVGSLLELEGAEHD